MDTDGRRFVLAGTAIATIMIPADMLWSDDMSRTIRISQENWERLEHLVGTEGTTDEKIRRALEMAGSSPRSEEQEQEPQDKQPAGEERPNQTETRPS